MIWLTTMLGPWLIRLIGGWCRYRVIGQENLDRLEAGESGVILALWHGRMLMPVYHQRNTGVVSLVSLHRDGEMIARIVQRLGYTTRRGSPKEGGLEGFKAMLKDLREGKTVAIFPDGPTGPARSVRDGVLLLARLSGAPILPLAYSANPCWRAKSWDGYMIPKPFSRATIVYGEPFTIPRQIKDDENGKYRTLIRDRIDDAVDKADRDVRQPSCHRDSR